MQSWNRMKEPVKNSGRPNLCLACCGFIQRTTASPNRSNRLTVAPTYFRKHSPVFPGPKMVAVRNYHGTPTPPGKTPLCFQTGDFIELLKGEPDTSWWEVLKSVTSKWTHRLFLQEMFLNHYECWWSVAGSISESDVTMGCSCNTLNPPNTKI